MSQKRKRKQSQRRINKILIKNKLTDKEIKDLMQKGDYSITHNLDMVIDTLENTPGAITKTVNKYANESALKNSFKIYIRNRTDKSHDSYVSKMDIRVAMKTLNINCNNERYAISQSFLRALKK